MLPNIPVVTHFKNCELDIYPSLQTITSTNFNHTFKNLKSDLIKRTKLPNCFQSCQSSFKKNVLPCINFYSSMLPLAPPPSGYWEKLIAIISKCIWKSKHIQMSTLQWQKLCRRPRCFKFDILFLVLCSTSIAYMVETKHLGTMASPKGESGTPAYASGQVYSNIPLKPCKLKCGSIISQLILVWRQVESHSKIKLKWHLHSPLFHNVDLLLGKNPIAFPSWSEEGMHTFNDIMADCGLRASQNLQSHYKIPGTSFFSIYNYTLRCVLAEYPGGGLC